MIFVCQNSTQSQTVKPNPLAHARARAILARLVCFVSATFKHVTHSLSYRTRQLATSPICDKLDSTQKRTAIFFVFFLVCVAFHSIEREVEK